MTSTSDLSLAPLRAEPHVSPSPNFRAILFALAMSLLSSLGGWLDWIGKIAISRLESAHAQGRPRPRHQPRRLHRPPRWRGRLSLHAPGLFDGGVNGGEERGHRIVP